LNKKEDKESRGRGGGRLAREGMEEGSRRDRIRDERRGYPSRETEEKGEIAVSFDGAEARESGGSR